MGARTMDGQQHASASQRLGPFTEDRTRGERCADRHAALEAERGPATRGGDGQASHAPADRIGEKTDDRAVACHRGRHEVVTMKADGFGIVRAAGPAQEEWLLALTEDEQL